MGTFKWVLWLCGSLTGFGWTEWVDPHFTHFAPCDFVPRLQRQHSCWLSDYVERWEHSRRFCGIGGQSRTAFVFCGRGGALWHFFRAVNFSGDVSMCTVMVHCVSEGEFHIRRPSSSTDFIQLLAVVGAPAGTLAVNGSRVHYFEIQVLLTVGPSLL